MNPLLGIVILTRRSSDKVLTKDGGEGKCSKKARREQKKSSEKAEKKK
uniref:Uncharacterized protein n=1 Tax=Rhizophora mucronata TaxID=61149 RepID=A0A2P2IMZ8_RHIMU